MRAATTLLGRDVTGFITEHRDCGVSYSAIARLLAAQTHGGINVTGEAVRKWHNRRTDVAA